MYQLYWTAFRSLLGKEINRFMRIWVQTLVPPAITMTLYFIIFGNLMWTPMVRCFLFLLMVVHVVRAFVCKRCPVSHGVRLG